MTADPEHYIEQPRIGGIPEELYCIRMSLRDINKTLDAMLERMKYAR